MDYGPLSLIHRLLSCAMCLHLSLCAFLRFYGPLFCSMFHYSALWAFIPFYVPSFRPMCRPSILWASILFYVPLSASMCLPSILWASILFYVPLFRSMCLHLVLCALVPPYVPSFRSMCHHSPLCAVIPIYGPSSTFYVPTTTTITTKKPNDDCSTNRHSVLTTRASLHRSTLSSLSTHSICLSLRLRLVLCNRGCRRLQMSCRPYGRLEKVQPNACRQHAIYQHDRRCIVASCFASGSPW